MKKSSVFNESFGKTAPSPAVFLLSARLLRHGLALIFMLQVFALGGAEAPVNEQTAPKILLISSFHLSHRWTMEVNNAIVQELDKLPGPPIVDYLELNSVRNRTLDFVSKFEPYRRLIQDGEYDVVVGILDDAINLLSANLDSIPSDLPVVFCGYQELNGDFTRLHPNVTGLAVNLQIMKTIDLGLALMPDTQEIAVVTDDLPSGQMLHRRMQQEAGKFRRCKLTLLSGAEYSTDEMLAKVRSMPEKSFVVFTPWRNYARDGYSSLLSVGDALGKTGRPYMVVTDVLLGKGALGGCMSIGKNSGQQMAQIIHDVLDNRRTAAVPFVYDLGSSAVDMAVLKQFGLSADALPPDTLRVNREIPLWESHRIAVTTGVVAIFLLILLIAALIIIHLRFRRLTLRMHEKQDFLLADLNNHVSNERIFNWCLQKITLEKDSDKAIQQMLKTIGAHIGADRIYIFQYHDDSYADNVYEWTASGISPQIENLQKVDMNLFPQVYKVFSEKRPLEIADTSCPSPDIQYSAEFLRRQEIQSALLCGIWEQNKLWGFIGIDFVRNLHSFTESDRQMISNAINLFLLARERQRQIEAISEGAFLQKQIFDSIMIPIVMFDLDFNITMVNPALCRITGKTAEELLGQKCHEMLCGHDSPPEWCPMCKIMVDRQPHQINFEGHGNRHYMVSLQPVFDRENQMTGVLESALDITDLFNQKREQEISNTFLRRAGEIAEITYFRGDAAGNVRLLGGSSANMASLKDNGNFAEWMIPEDRELFIKNKDDLTAGRVEIMEMICHSATSGSIRTYRLYATVFNRQDELYLGMLQDVTDSTKLEDEKNALLERQNAYAENEKILNACLIQLVQDEDFDRNINHILETLANQLGSDRAYYGRYSSGGADYGIAYEWLSSGVSSLHEVRDPRFKAQFLRWYRNFDNDELLEIPDIVNSQFAEILREPGCQTLLCAPVTVNHELIGVIGLGFIRKRRDISELDENMIRSVAQIISIALQRDARHRELDTAIGEREAVFRHIGIPIMLFDSAGKLTRVNPSTCEIMEKSDVEILSGPCYNTFCLQKSRPEWCPVLQTLSTGKGNEIEFELNGREYVIKSEPAFDKLGNIRYVIESAIDITEINENKRQLEKAVMNEQAANKAKSYFLATMSHEIRTPLNAVIGFAELLKEGGLSQEEQLEYLDSINFSGNSLLRLINDVLDLSKLESDHTVLISQPTDINALLRDIHAVFQYSIQKKKLFFHLDCPPDLPTLKLDNIRLRQILLNLIGNAVKFTDEGGVTLTVEFQRGSDGETGTLSIGVRDTGIGISRDMQQKIFQPFVQSDAVRDTHVYGGTGLGLAISLRLVERMNGSITLESEVGKGSCFVVRLINVAMAPSIIPPPKEKIAVMPQNIRALLVDDIPMNLKVLQAMLRKLKIACVCASSGSEALKILEQDRNFNFILTDLWMPKMNGAQLAEAIKKLPECKSMKIMAVTADTESPANFDMTLFDGILHKPFDLDRLRKLFCDAGNGN